MFDLLFNATQDSIGPGGFPKEDLHSSTDCNVSRALQTPMRGQIAGTFNNKQEKC